MQSRLQMGLLRTLHVDLQQNDFISSTKTLSVSNKWDFSASETDFSLSCIFHISRQQRSLYCCMYEIQSMEGREQGVVLHKALRVSNEPQDRMLL